MSFYDELRAAVGPGSELEATFGLPAILTRTTTSERDPDTGKVKNKARTDIPVNVAKRKVEVTTENGGKSEATAFDMWVKPVPGDVITFGGATYRVEKVEADEPDGLPMSYLAIVGSGS